MTNESGRSESDVRRGLINAVILFCLQNKLVVFLAVLAILGAGLAFAPFDWDLGGFPRNPVPVDAIPDIGENQQIVFTRWTGRSPQDVEDQITYPLTVSLLGVPGVRTIRSHSFFGFSTIYIIFEEDIEFYWSRSRILEKLGSLPADTLPDEVTPALGPDATSLGQIFWYTLEGRDQDGRPSSGWSPQELRSIQDWYVRYALLASEGIAEVASVGGYVQEYQIDVDPDAMRAYNVQLDEVFMAVKMSNVDVGARNIEVNRVEYFIRGLGFIKSRSDIENAVIKVNDGVPIYVRNVAKVTRGPALRRGALDKSGAEAVGGVVVVRYGENPLAAIKNVKKKIEEISPSLPKKTLPDGTVSKVSIVPFYDRTGLIYETLGTLSSALSAEILVTIIVVIVSLMHLRSSMLISGLLPLTVLMCFIAMKLLRVDANIVALSGIAIAIGTIVDMGIIVCENIIRHLGEAAPDDDRLQVIYRAVSEVGGAVVTAILTTVISFLPVFTMTAAEGKLFKPLAFTKTFALLASVIVALMVVPAAAHVLFTWRIKSGHLRRLGGPCLVVVGVVMTIAVAWWAGAFLAFLGLWLTIGKLFPERRRYGSLVLNAIVLLAVGVLLTTHWTPLGVGKGFVRNFVFVAVLIGGLMALFHVFHRFYAPLLRWCLSHKALFLAVPLLMVVAGGTIWVGFDSVFGLVPAVGEAITGKPGLVRSTALWSGLRNAFPGLGKEFMPPLDEGSFLLMPTTMPHASIGEALDVLQKQDMAIQAIPEIDSVVGKIGRVESSLDPAPISMIETVINYKSEYITDKNGHRKRFRYDNRLRDYTRDERGRLIEDPHGKPYRQWREHIKSPDDIWQEIVSAAQIPGTTGAPKLQPIAARIVMLQSGMRAPMGVKIKGPELETIENVGLSIERLLKEVPSVEPASVIADRIVGKPYLEIEIDREKTARHGIMIRNIQDVIEVAIGGRRVTTTVEGRERYPVRVRYMRELRDQIETLGKILVPGSDGEQIPLSQLTTTRYVRGPQVIKSEDTFLVGYVLFDKRPGNAEVDVVEECRRHLQAKIESGALELPAGVSFTFAGSYESQIRSQRTLSAVLPVALFAIFMILYFQFRSVPISVLVFSGIAVAWAGGFLMIWLYGQSWFMNFSVFGLNMRGLFQMHQINLSVAIWVGFLALFGIASDNGVVIVTYLNQRLEQKSISSITEIREATVEAAMRRIRPCLMTSATTILALIPVLTSTGRGSDVMVPMAIPSFGGMTVVLISMFVVPVLYCLIRESGFRSQSRVEAR